MACAFSADREPTQSGMGTICDPPDDRGHYVLEGLPPEDYQVSVTADGYRPRIANKGEPVRLRDKDVVLPDTDLDEGGALISGTVVDATGGPVVGATVQASFASDELPLGRYMGEVTKSGAAGAFTLSVSEGHVLLVARSDGYAAARAGTHAPAAGIRLVLTPSSRISGMVVSQSDRSPVAGLRVVARMEGFEQAAVSDRAGVFDVVGLRPGVYGLEASGEGWIGRHPGSVTVDISDAAENVVVPVGRAVRVTGAIRVGEGPCRAGRAYLTPAAGLSLPTLTEMSDLSGRVAFAAVPAGTYQSSALCDGYGRVPGPDVQVVGANVEDVSWTFQRGVNVTVRAETPDGQPVPRARIHLAPASDASRSEPTAPTPKSGQANTDGLVHFLGVAEGRYVVGGPNVDTPIKVDVRAGNSPVEVKVILGAVGAIQVHVRDAQGKANDHVAVTAVPKAGVPNLGIGESRGSGRYDIGPLAAGEYQVEIRDGVDPVLNADGPDGLVHVRAGQVATLEVTYGGHSGRIAGRVLDGDGIPVQNVWVHAQTSSGEGYGMLLELTTQAVDRRCLTNTEGRFAIDGLSETALFSIVASHPLGGETSANGVSVGQTVELTLRTPGSLGGVVLTSNGRPPPYFQIMISSKENAQQLHPEFGPDAQGRWFVDHVAAGTVEIRAQTAEGGATVVRELAPSQAIKDIELRLQPLPSAFNLAAAGTKP
jgi:hypothetical protein